MSATVRELGGEGRALATGKIIVACEAAYLSRLIRGEFVVAHSKPGRRYASEATAEKAARAWMAA